MSAKGCLAEIGMRLLAMVIILVVVAVASYLISGGDKIFWLFAF